MNAPLNIINHPISQNVGNSLLQSGVIRSGYMCLLSLRNVHEITSTTRLSFCPFSAFHQQLHSLLCACWCALNTNKNPAPVVELIPCAFLTMVLNCSSLFAEEIINTPIGNNNNSVIDSPDVSSSQGVTTVNVTAGDSNLQANVGVIAVGMDGARTDTNSIIIQKNEKAGNFSPANASASITGHAFSNSNGWTAINQASGQANMQANMMEIGIGNEYEIGTVNDQILSQSFSDAGESDLAAKSQNSERLANIDDTALSGMSGVVQVNQTAGSGNSTSNTFVFQINGNGLR